MRFSFIINNGLWAKKACGWLIVTYWWLSKYYKWFPLILILLPWSSLSAFWMNHIRRISITKKNLTCGLPIAAKDILRLLSGLSIQECRKPRLELSQKRKDSLWIFEKTLWISYTNIVSKKCPSKRLQREFLFITDCSMQNSSGWKRWRWDSVSVGLLSFFCNTQLLEKTPFVQITLRIQFKKCSKGEINQHKVSAIQNV